MCGWLRARVQLGGFGDLHTCNHGDAARMQLALVLAAQSSGPPSHPYGLTHPLESAVRPAPPFIRQVRAARNLIRLPPQLPSDLPVQSCPPLPAPIPWPSDPVNPCPAPSFQIDGKNQILGYAGPLYVRDDGSALPVSGLMVSHRAAALLLRTLLWCGAHAAGTVMLPHGWCCLAPKRVSELRGLALAH